MRLKALGEVCEKMMAAGVSRNFASLDFLCGILLRKFCRELHRCMETIAFPGKTTYVQ